MSDSDTARCTCGWQGEAKSCIADIDGRGNLGCPMCRQIITIIVLAPKQKRPGPSETK